MINLEFRLLCKTFERKGLNKKQNWETQYDLPQETTSRKKTALTAAASASTSKEGGHGFLS